MKELHEKLRGMEEWPITALDKKRDVVVFRPAFTEDLDALRVMYRTFEPKLAVQGLPPLDPDTRAEWIRHNLDSGINIIAELDGAITAHGLLCPLPRRDTAEFGLFVHNRFQKRGLGMSMALLQIAAAKRLGFEKLWVSEERTNSSAVKLYLKSGFQRINPESVELEFELDLSSVSGDIDLSERALPVAEPTGRITAPDYLDGQDIYDDTESVLIFSPEFEKVSMPPEHPFTTARSRLVLDMLKKHDLMFLDRTQILKPAPLDEESVLAFHRKQYYYHLTMMSQGAFVPQMLEQGIGTADNPVLPDMLGYAMLAAGASVSGADMLLNGNNISLVFSPTGGFHHAGAHYAAGFCYINDAVLAIKYLLQSGLDRVLYIDIDAHHGDGVQFAFYEDPRVLTISMHESGRTLFPWTSGFENELGDGPGHGYTVNMPLAPGTNDDIYRDAFQRVVAPLARAFNAHACVAVIGADTMYSDPLSNLSLTNNVFAELVLEINRFAPRTLLLGGGGYNPDNIARAWTLAWAALHNAEPQCDYFGQVGMLAPASEMDTGALRDPYPFITPMKIAEARAEARRVIAYLHNTVFPIHGIKPF